jgi:DNA-binding MarR family transcriptional regulator
MEQNGVSVSEWVALRHLYEHADLTQVALIDALGMSKGAISKVIARLEQKGLVERASSEEDRRAQRIALTSVGHKLVPRLAKLADENDAVFFGHLSAKARAELVNTMKDIVRRQELREVPVD